MPVVNVRELSRRTGVVISTVRRTKRPTLVTLAGRPVAAVVPVDTAALEDWILAHAPEFVSSMATAEDDLKQGRTVSIAELLAETTAGRKRATSRR
jgi:prevent-host-death family protein